TMSGPIQLMTGHKSKGLEFDNVFILDKQLLREEGQDKNLLYVMQTRAKETLTYIYLNDFVYEGNGDE
ncbi:ATP-binding domain-containing protein, partial [Loigolactobacillus coryniformis]|uniref:ATP-binding domain-containing protein n=1 Tax=Loigolactobacillus coryniformis TaxID=1610 RepID=UPI00201B2D7E